MKKIYAKLSVLATAFSLFGLNAYALNIKSLPATEVNAESASSDEIVTTPPAGTTVTYYADMRNDDNVFGFMYDNHISCKIVFCDNGDVYLPNLLMRNTMGAYVRGSYDKSTGTISVPAGQAVYQSPNTDDFTRVYLLDASGNAGNKDTNEFYSAPLTFHVDNDGVITFNGDYPYFGICNETDVEECYGIGYDLTFTPTENVEGDIEYFTLNYVYDANETAYSTTISGYGDDDVRWFKGLSPKYPDAWMKLQKNGNTTDTEQGDTENWLAYSFQVMNFSSYDYPYVAAAATFGYDDSGNDQWTAYNYLPFTYNPETKTFTAATDGMMLTMLTTYDEQEVQFLQAYKSLKVEPKELKFEGLTDPTFTSYDAESTPGETEFIFMTSDLDIAGNSLVKDALYFRMYIDGELYTFTAATYPKFKEDVSLVPFSTNLYGVFMSNTAGDKRYVYFQNLPADIKNIGVEQVYIMNGKEYTSRRLVYDIASATAGYSDSSAVEKVNADKQPVSVVRYNVNGQRVSDTATGMIITVERYNDGTTHSTKSFRR
jgi:hypothetical protein